MMMRRDKFHALDPPLRTAPDLLTQNYFRYGTLNYGFIAHAFSTTNNSALRQIWSNMLTSEDPVFTSTNAEGLERVRRENYIYILPSTIASYVASRPPCDLVSTDKFLLQKHFALALQKNSLLLDDVNWALSQLEATGALNRLYNKWWHSNSTCPVTNDVVSSHVVGASVFHNDITALRPCILNIMTVLILNVYNYLTTS